MKTKLDYSLCGNWLRHILARDGWTLHWISHQRPVEGEAPAEPRLAGRLALQARGAVFLAKGNGRTMAFFFSDQPTRKLTAAFRAIQQKDHGRFRSIGVLIAPTTAEMQRLRSARYAKRFPRAFFASVEEIREAAAPKRSLEGEVRDGLATPVGAPAEPSSQRSGYAASFQARVLANLQIGGPQSPLWRLVFKAPGMEEILPPQFVMMDTTPKRLPLGSRAVRRGNLRGAVDLTPQPLLKRPFGICRAFLPHFAPDYVKRLTLPPSLALVLHPPTADYFDMLYKVLPDGIGTPLMTKLKRGQKMDMVGPLGRPFDVRRLRGEGVEEVHVIGGGVGMAPLILLVEMLRYYAFPVKVFLGIAGFESIRYRDELGATFGEKSRDAYVYIDDLLAAGVKPADIYVSCDSEVPAEDRARHSEGESVSRLGAGTVPEVS